MVVETFFALHIVVVLVETSVALHIVVVVVETSFAFHIVVMVVETSVAVLSASSSLKPSECQSQPPDMNARLPFDRHNQNHEPVHAMSNMADLHMTQFSSFIGIFCLPPYPRQSVACGFFNVENQIRAEVQMHSWYQKCLESHQHSTKKECFKCQAINLILPKLVKVWSTVP